MMITYYIGIGVVLAWALLGYVGHRYFVWREWDEDRRIARARKVARDRVRIWISRTSTTSSTRRNQS